MSNKFIFNEDINKIITKNRIIIDEFEFTNGGK